MEPIVDLFNTPGALVALVFGLVIGFGCSIFTLIVVDYLQ